SGGWVTTDAAREHIARDLAADVVALLGSPATVEGRPVAPGDLAVLVRRNRDAELVREELERAGVPAVLNGAGSVFATPAAGDWLTLLEALERPSAPGRARAAANTDLLGWSAAEIATAPDEALDDLHARLHGWARLLRTRGVAALAEAVTQAQRVPERLLGRADGERRMTDLRHVAQLLHAAAMEEALGVAALAGWLRRRVDAAAQETGDEERSRRLESDAQAVQVLTIHRSKGLEFPIVYLPFLWHPSWMPREPVPVAFHDGTCRRVDVGLEGRDYHRHRRLDELEQRGEDLRLAYVALTRARHQAVVWWAGTKPAKDSPLSRLLFFRGEDGSVPGEGAATPSDDAALARLQALAGEAPGCVAVERSLLAGLPARWAPPPPGRAELRAAAFERSLDARWRRTSYTALTAAAHEAWVGSEPEDGLVADEPAADAEADALAVEAGAPDHAEGAPLLAAMPGGVHVGSLLHDLLEGADFAAPDLDAELREHLGRARTRRHVEL
ncbi:MAG TPA: 3'-5' exonuclease, partial [Capillimicrobium sp.]